MSSRLSLSLPKTAVVCGAHTEVGKFVIRELVRSPQIEVIYALAEVDCRDEIHVRPHEEPKLRFFIFNLDDIEKGLDRFVPDAHIAFCCLGSSKNDFSALGPYEFHRLNFDIPRRFIRYIFGMQIQRVGVLSQAGADSKSKMEHLRVKGELIDFIAGLQTEMGRFAPGVSLLKPPLLLTDMRDQNGCKGTAISTFDRIKQSAALKLEMGPSRAVHVREVAKAMVAETLQNADVQEENELAHMFKKEGWNISELSGPEIVNLAEDTRALQRSAYARQMQSRSDESARIRVSQYARDEGGFTSLNDDPLEFDGEEPSEGRTPRHYEERSYVDSRSTRNDDDSAPRGTSFRDDEGSEGATRPPFPGGDYEQYSGPESEDFERSAGGDEEQQHEASPRAIGSVESLGQQIGRRLTKVNGNRLLPDVEHRLPRRRSRAKSPRLTPPDTHDPYARSRESPEWNQGELQNDPRGYEDILDGPRRLTGSTVRTLGSNSDPLDSPTSRDLGDVGAISTDFSVPMEAPVLDMQTPSPITRPYENILGHMDQYGTTDSPRMQQSKRISSDKYDPSLREARNRSRQVLGDDELSRNERFISLFNKIMMDASPRKGDSARKPEPLSEHEMARRHRANMDMRAVGETTI